MTFVHYPVRLSLTVFSLLVMLAFSLVPSWAAKKEKTECGGIDMLAQMRVGEPADYTQIVAKSLLTKNDGAILWRVSRHGGAPSYLMGTLHLSDPRVTALSSAASAALNSARVLAVEVEDLSQTATARAIASAAHLVVFSGDQTLGRYLSPEELEIVSQKLSKLGLSEQMAPRFKPWIVSLLTAVGACERARVTRGHLVLDMKLTAVARERGIPVVGIETLTSQLESAAAVPFEEQVQTLRTSIKYTDRANDLMETLIGFYLGRRIGAAIPFQLHLARKAGFDRSGLAGFQRELIFKRNRKMRTRVLPLLAEGGAFIAVGALHLVGDTGLVALLRKAGYDVTPIE